MADLPDDHLETRAGAMLHEVLLRTHLSQAADLATILAEESRQIGVDGLVVYLADLEERVLVPIPGPDTGDRVPMSVNGTVGGRSYATSAAIDAEVDDGRRLWMPLLDGTDRLGVIEMTFLGRTVPLSGAALAIAERYAHFISVLVVAKTPYSDVLKSLRRRHEMTTASELLRELVPPQVVATEDFLLAAALEPTYDVGGDAYDYAINGRTLHAGVFDGVGHGLSAAGVTAFALSVYRHCRRHGGDLAATYAAIDAEVADQYPTSRYVTGCLAELDVRDGTLHWVNAGHPAPMLLRRGRFIKHLEVKRSPPMGLRFADKPPVVGEEALEPGDMLLLYTDGLTESRRPDGRLFTTERLAEFIERQAAAGEPAPETLRRLRQAIVERGEGALRDDATALLIEWRRGTEREILPPTVGDGPTIRDTGPDSSAG